MPTLPEERDVFSAAELVAIEVVTATELLVSPIAVTLIELAERLTNGEVPLLTLLHNIKLPAFKLSTVLEPEFSYEFCRIQKLTAGVIKTFDQ